SYPLHRQAGRLPIYCVFWHSKLKAAAEARSLVGMLSVILLSVAICGSSIPAWLGGWGRRQATVAPLIGRGRTCPDGQAGTSSPGAQPGRWSANFLQNAAHFLGREGAQRLTAEVAELAEAQQEGRRRLLVREVGNGDHIVRSLRPVDGRHAPAHLLNGLARLLGAVHRSLDVLDALLSPIHQRHVGGHGNLQVHASAFLPAHASILVARGASVQPPGLPRVAIAAGCPAAPHRPRPPGTPKAAGPAGGTMLPLSAAAPQSDCRLGYLTQR